jgi:RsiW-degrading membrane proteinase PrsW (M82 family)
MPDDARKEKGRPDLGSDIEASQPREDPRPAAVTFATTEHFTLQGARASTIAESTGRATIFLGAVSGGLVALGLIATASRVGTAFYTFGLVLLPTLAFVGVVTFERVLQSGIEDLGYARRIALLRGYYFDEAPELTPYLMSVPEPQRLSVLGLWAGHRQSFRTVAGMVAVITAVLAGSAAGLLAAVASDHSLTAALIPGSAVAVAALAAMMRYQHSVWERSAAVPLSDAYDTEPPRP